MTLPFMTHFPKGLVGIGGKETSFVSKIWHGVLQMNIEYEVLHQYRDKCISKGLLQAGEAFKHHPKIHTMREDPHNRWKPGTKIHMVLNNRSPQRFQFAPEILCKGTQKVQICHFAKDIYGDRGPEVYIDDLSITGDKLLILSQNDGFDTVDDFFAYFNKAWSGKIIHWTDLKY